jgi:5-methylcytosine-specific restriction enzyme subunit McrC
MPTSSINPVIYECHERRPVDGLPMDQILSATGSLDILPSSRGYFDIDYRGNRLTLVAGRYIGLIPINNHVLIDVRPKMPIRSLLRLLDIAGEEIGALNFFERGYREEPGVDRNVLDLMIKTLLNQMQSVEQDGLFKVYRRENRIGTYRGKINFGRTLQSQWSRGKFLSAQFELFDYSRDNCLNRLLKYTLLFAGNFLKLRGRRSEDQKTLASFYDLFERVPLDSTLSFVSESERMLKHGEIPPLRGYYNDIVRTCLLILKNRSVSLDVLGTDVSLLSFVLNLEDVFEKYVRNILKRLASQLRPELRVLDGNSQFESYLFSDSRSIRIKPDIIIRRDRNNLLLGDVKYKPKLSETDRYQIISHALSLSAPKAVLIMPSFAGESSGLIRRGRVGDESGVEVFEYCLQLDEALEHNEKKFATEILTMV